jgi:hypothetical protein
MIKASINDYTEGKEGVKIGVYYNIAIYSAEEHVKTLGKRYSDFLQLHELLLSLKCPLILTYPFPRKSLTNGFLNKIKIASERKKILNDYLHLLLSIEPVAEAVLEFLELPVRDTTATLIDASNIETATQLELGIKEDLQFKLSPKIAEKNTTVSRCSFLKRNMIILSSCVVVGILIISVTFTGKIRNVYGEGYVDSVILESGNNTLLSHGKAFFIFRSWEIAKFWIRFLISIVIFFASFHRLLGKLFSFYVRWRLGRKRVGSFLVEVEWIGIRLGFDRNEILLHNIMFRNPPAFTDTPFFVSVEDVLIR